jgi:outer membrane protein OmpA-like peptidoglycan-associated protein
MGERLYNEMLGQRRAESVKKEFIKRGIAEDRLVVFSKASDMPVLNNETKSERTKNRRVTIFVRERKNESL